MTDTTISYFASYSHRDHMRVKAVVRLLRTAPVEVFLDEDSIEPGAPWEMTLGKRLDEAAVVILFWSKFAERSDWVKREIDHAISTQKRIIPVLLDNSKLPENVAKFQHINLCKPLSTLQRSRVLSVVVFIFGIASVAGIQLSQKSEFSSPAPAQTDVDRSLNSERALVVGSYLNEEVAPHSSTEIAVLASRLRFRSDLIDFRDKLESFVGKELPDDLASASGSVLNSVNLIVDSKPEFFFSGHGVEFVGHTDSRFSEDRSQQVATNSVFTFFLIVALVLLIVGALSILNSKRVAAAATMAQTLRQKLLQRGQAIANKALDAKT